MPLGWRIGGARVGESLPYSIGRGERHPLPDMNLFILQTARIYSVATGKEFGWWFAVDVIL